MGFCDLVPPSDVQPERLVEMERALSEAGRCVRMHLPSSGARSAAELFSWLTRSYRRGSAIEAGATTVSAEDAAKVAAVKDMEAELLSAFSRAVENCVLRCCRRYGRRPDELDGAAYECFLNAMVNYDGSSRFSTFLFICLNRGLARFCVGQNELGVPVEVSKLVSRVTAAMSEGGCTFDDAVARLGVDRGTASKVCAAMRTVRNATDLNIDESGMASVRPREEALWVSEAVKRAKLGTLERAALDAFLQSPKGVQGLSEGCRYLLNPDTGRPYSRAAVSSAFRRAKDKVARVLGEAA